MNTEYSTPPSEDKVVDPARRGKPKGARGTYGSTKTLEERANETVKDNNWETYRGGYTAKRKRGRGRPKKNKIPLTKKQEMYCRYRVEKQMGKTKAYEIAYGEGRADPYQYAYMLERKPHIIERIKQLREEVAATAAFYEGPASSLARWQELWEMALKQGDLKLAAKAQENIDKITGADKGVDPVGKEMEKLMFLNKHHADDDREYKKQITGVLENIQSKGHVVKKENLKEITLEGKILENFEMMDKAEKVEDKKFFEEKYAPYKEGVQMELLKEPEKTARDLELEELRAIVAKLTPPQD